ncbi:DUF4062 domain-containing protein (plasmid) [Staphylococcus aureus]|nr:DUF4062 domain-containing protein [Staphylococcus aureus]WRM95481.1 DUF4062 domain-containing protein [Staphylococcus aureus]WRN10116.1 DUF4062 domain-containing protein [Staphylococcus aureus]WRN68337.1 DUF4062 domain-containing protein [Staphylococcus aureus]
MSNTKIKYQIFISSTYLDLIEERQAVVEAVLNSNNIPAGMEQLIVKKILAIQKWSTILLNL